MRSVPPAGLRVFVVGAHLAAGRTFTSRTTSAPWAARESHTSVVDAAGAIYVIGGRSSGRTYYKDVWASTDGGARPDSVGGVVGGYYWGVLPWYSGVLGGRIGYSGLLEG